MYILFRYSLKSNSSSIILCVSSEFFNRFWKTINVPEDAFLRESKWPKCDQKQKQKQNKKKKKRKNKTKKIYFKLKLRSYNYKCRKLVFSSDGLLDKVWSKSIFLSLGPIDAIY